MGEIINFPQMRITTASRIEQIMRRVRQMEICPPVLIFWEDNVRILDLNKGERNGNAID